MTDEITETGYTEGSYGPFGIAVFTFKMNEISLHTGELFFIDKNSNLELSK